MARQCSPSPPADPALDALRRAPSEAPRLLLHSGRPDPRWASRSLLAEPRAWFRHVVEPGRRTGRSELFNAADHAPMDPPAPLTHRPLADLRMLLKATRRFPGKWVGFLSYDLGRALEPRKLAAVRPTDRPWPLIELGWCPQMQELPPGVPAAEPTGEDAAAGQAEARSNFTRAGYERAVDKVLGYIGAGDVFQVNLSQRFSAETTEDPRTVFQRLAAVSPAWYGAHLELPPFDEKWDLGESSRMAMRELSAHHRRALCSTSPELFLRVDGRRVVTRPIKGTRPATGGDPRADPARGELMGAEKDAAELHMIVDLMRNDLGRVCEYGSVRVTEPRRIETHPTVHHATATVEGTLHGSKDIVDLLKATLPGGSVTGAPKVRAMQIIDELEPHPRGPYCGCIGYLSNDEARLNIAIRTIALTPSPEPGRSDRRGAESRVPGRALYTGDFSAGGGIVADSDSAAEYEETLDKANAMLQALGASTGDRAGPIDAHNAPRP